MESITEYNLLNNKRLAFDLILAHDILQKALFKLIFYRKQGEWELQLCLRE